MHRFPEQKCISEAGNKGPQLGAFSQASGLRPIIRRGVSTGAYISPDSPGGTRGTRFRFACFLVSDARPLPGWACNGYSLRAPLWPPAFQFWVPLRKGT